MADVLITINNRAFHLLGRPMDAGATAELPAFLGVSGEIAQPAIDGTNVGGGVGVFADGHHAQGVGLHARGGRLAGRFDGNVEVTGKLNGHSIEQLAQRIAALEAVPVTGLTRFGIPVSPPVAKPSINVTGLSSGGSEAHFQITGSGFVAGSNVVLRGINTTKAISYFGVLPGSVPAAQLYFLTGDIGSANTSKFPATTSGNLNAVLNHLHPCDPGDTMLFCATDGRFDANDSTDLLWSNEFRFTVH